MVSLYALLFTTRLLRELQIPNNLQLTLFWGGSVSVFLIVLYVGYDILIKGVKNTWVRKYFHLLALVLFLPGSHQVWY